MSGYVGQLRVWEPHGGKGWRYEMVEAIDSDGAPLKVRSLTPDEFEVELKRSERNL